MDYFYGAFQILDCLSLFPLIVLKMKALICIVESAIEANVT